MLLLAASPRPKQHERSIQDWGLSFYVRFRLHMKGFNCEEIPSQFCKLYSYTSRWLSFWRRYHLKPAFQDFLLSSWCFHGCMDSWLQSEKYKDADISSSTESMRLISFITSKFLHHRVQVSLSIVWLVCCWQSSSPQRRNTTKSRTVLANNGANIFVMAEEATVRIRRIHAMTPLTKKRLMKIWTIRPHQDSKLLVRYVVGSLSVSAYGLAVHLVMPFNYLRANRILQVLLTPGLGVRDMCS